MLVTVFTVAVLALGVTVVVMMVVMMVVNRCVAVRLLLKAKGQRGLVPGCHVEPVFLLQLPSGLVPLCLQLSQSFSDELLLSGEKG